MKTWIKQGLIQAFRMLVVMGIVFPLVDNSFSVIRLLTGIPVFIGVGLLWGYFIFGRKTTKKTTAS